MLLTCEALASYLSRDGYPVARPEHPGGCDSIDAGMVYHPLFPASSAVARRHAARHATKASGQPVFSPSPPIQVLAIVRVTPGHPPGRVALLHRLVDWLALLNADAVLNLYSVVSEIQMPVTDSIGRILAAFLDRAV